MSNKYFLDQVVPHFFALQLHCYRIYPMLEFSKTVPVDPIIRQNRASKGGNSKAVGEDLLREKFSKFLASLAGQSFKSKKAFYWDLGDHLSKSLDEYKTDHLGKPHPESKKKVTYGHDLTAESLERKFREWQKSDPVFAERLLGLLPKNKKASEGS